MKAKTLRGWFGGSIGMALVLGTLGVVGSTPAFGHDAASSAAKNGEQQEQRATEKVEADVSRLQQDFAVLPPEVSSALKYAGSGSGTVLASATAWDELAAELQTAANSYSSVVSELTGQAWLGPGSSSSTATAAAPYVAWMHTTAQEAEQAAAQASAQAAAFEGYVKGAAGNG
jgi:PPE family protein